MESSQSTRSQQPVSKPSKDSAKTTSETIFSSPIVSSSNGSSSPQISNQSKASSKETRGINSKTTNSDTDSDFGDKKKEDICGVLNQHGAPCQRVGKCPFHATDKKPRLKRGWTKDEHTLFLKGLQIYGKGNWKDISSMIPTKNATQIQSHAQKYFLRQKQVSKNKRSIHDFSLEDYEAIPTNAEMAMKHHKPSQSVEVDIADPRFMVPDNDQTKFGVQMMPDATYPVYYASAENPLPMNMPVNVVMPQNLYVGGQPVTYRTFQQQVITGDPSFQKNNFQLPMPRRSQTQQVVHADPFHPSFPCFPVVDQEEMMRMNPQLLAAQLQHMQQMSAYQNFQAQAAWMQQAKSESHGVLQIQDLQSIQQHPQQQPQMQQQQLQHHMLRHPE
eukprot:TRINITY_DN8822_c0_g1_i1.p1 TRINITY_DN8822_c0_g1~~TRINITY_DN8822_c0_g1_i1.p1  ORF type:complete len:387 (-),score=74.66 TRINITY_DN8822_c0_g1_i1:11-1171(-)